MLFLIPCWCDSSKRSSSKRYGVAEWLQDEEDEEVEVAELVIDGKTYYTDDSKNGSLFEYLEDGEIGDIVGHLENGSGFFLTI